MLIDLRKLLSGNEEVKEVLASIEMDTFVSNIGKYEIIEKKPFILTISSVDKNKLFISGNVLLSLNIPCDRCLESVKTDISFSLEKDVDMSEVSDGIEEKEEQDYIDGYNLDVDKLVFGEILINIPPKTLCKSNCKGLCLKCGNNLNVSECGCDRESLDPRMSVIQDIFNNFKEV